MSITIPDDPIKQYELLKEARRCVDHYIKLINDEMKDRGEKGEFFTNSMCLAWNDYINAQRNLNELREKLGT